MMGDIPTFGRRPSKVELQLVLCVISSCGNIRTVIVDKDKFILAEIEWINKIRC
jgi:hypothetical protein